MRKTTKLVLFAILLLAVLLIVPNISNAAEGDRTVYDETGLYNAIKEQVATITLGNDITLSEHALEVYHDLTIIGNGNAIIGTSTIVGESSPSNKTLITAMAGSNITLENVILEDSPKYGVQAYNGGTVVLDGVTINNCAFGGVLINGGIVTVKDLSLGFNGTNTNNGIEMDKGSVVTSEPTLIMQGTLSTTQSENVVRVLSEANVSNAMGTTNKIFVSGNSVVLTDANNNVLAEGAVDGGSVNEEVQKVILTIVSNGVNVEVVVDANSTISKELLDNNVALLEGQVVDGYYTDDTYSTEFSFDTVLTDDTTVYAKVSTETTSEEPTTTPGDEEESITTPNGEEQSTTEEVVEQGEKDETPKTGVVSYIGIAALVAIGSTIAVISLKRKNA